MGILIASRMMKMKAWATEGKAAQKSKNMSRGASEMLWSGLSEAVRSAIRALASRVTGLLMPWRWRMKPFCW